MHDAGLYLCLRVHSLDRFRETKQAVNDSNEDIIEAQVLEFVEDLQRELDTLSLFNPKPQHFFATIDAHASAKYTALFFTVPSSRILSHKASR